MKVSDLSIRNPAAIFTLVVAIVVTGAYCYVWLPREAAPDITIPIITITTTYRDVAPAEIESLITQKIEKKLKGLQGLDEIRSTSSEGRSSITVKFLPDVNIDDAMQKVRDKVDQAKGDLPPDADEPSLTEINISEFPILSVALYPEGPEERARAAAADVRRGLALLPGVNADALKPLEEFYAGESRRAGTMSIVRLKKRAEDLQDRLEQIPGVLQVNVVGGLEREVHLLINPDRLSGYNIPVTDLMTLVQRESVNVSGGKIDSSDTSYQVRVPGEFTDPLQIYSLIVTRREGSPIYLTDVARVEDGFADRIEYSRFRLGSSHESRENITLTLQKRSGENAVRICDEARKVLAASDDVWRQGIGYTVTMDMSENINMMIADLENNMFSAFVLVIAVVFTFMSFRNSLFVAVAIPASMLITFIVLMVLGLTLNIIVLFALVLASGMLVDNAVVIVENIYRHMQEGKPRVRAAMEATSEVAGPVINSTLTTVAAFLPMLFWPGVIGKFMGFLPKTVILVLLASLAVALTINPVFCAVFMKLRRKDASGEHKYEDWWLIRFYGNVLDLVLANRGITVLVMVAALASVIVAYAGWGRGSEFFPQVEPDRCQITLKLSEGAVLDSTDRVARAVEKRLLDVRDIDYVTTNVGVGASDVLGMGAGPSPNQARVSVEFVDREFRSQSTYETLRQIRKAIEDIPSASINVEKEEHGPPAGKPVEVELSGEDPVVLTGLLPQVTARIQNTPGLVDLKDDLVASKPEIQFPVDRNRAALSGMSTTWIGQFIQMYVRGIKLGVYREGEDEYDILLRIDDPQRFNVGKLMSQYVPDPAGNMVPLSSLAHIRFTGGFGDIQRVDQKRAVTLRGNNAEGTQPTLVLADVKARLAGFELPPGYRLRFRGQDEEMGKASSFLGKAFFVALILIAFLLIAEFNSISQAFIIMTAVIMSLIGVIAGLLLGDLSFSIIMTGIAVIGLAGVVVNNGIVLIAYINQLRDEGLSVRAAIVKGGKTRLRPVLLTAITTMLGLVPTVLRLSFDIHKWAWDYNSQTSQMWQNMAVCMFFGMAVATFLTLLVVPALYSLFVDAAAWLRWMWTGEEPAAENGR